MVVGITVTNVVIYPVSSAQGQGAGTYIGRDDRVCRRGRLPLGRRADLAFSGIPLAHCRGLGDGVGLAVLAGQLETGRSTHCRVRRELRGGDELGGPIVVST